MASSQAEQSQAEHSQAEPSFEALWLAYAYNRDKKAAREVWKALPTDTDRAAVIEAAAAWQASWAAQGKPDAPRKHLATWLREERYDEEAPKGFTRVERSKVKSPTTKPGKAKPRQPAAPITARVTASEVVTVGDVSELRFTATDEAGVRRERVIVLEHPSEKTQSEGQRQLAQLVTAAGIEQIEDSSELHGRTIVMTNDGFVAPDIRPDDDPPLPAKPEPVVYANPPPSKPMTAAEIAEIKARIDALPPMPRRKEFTITDEEREAWTADEDDDGDWPE